MIENFLTITVERFYTPLLEKVKFVVLVNKTSRQKINKEIEILNIMNQPYLIHVYRIV